MSKSFTPPPGVRSAARRGLELRRKWKRGGLSNSEASAEGVGSGVQRATNLANGHGISLEVIRQMNGFFSRHQSNYRPGAREADGGPKAGEIAWLLWGGNAGKVWAASILRQEDRVEKAEKLQGGKGDNKKPEAFDPKQLAVGVEHELEHTKDREIAREIAMDHLAEDPEYYVKLKKIEKSGTSGYSTFMFKNLNDPELLALIKSCAPGYKKAEEDVEKSEDEKDVEKCGTKQEVSQNGVVGAKKDLEKSGALSQLIALGRLEIAEDKYSQYIEKSQHYGFVDPLAADWRARPASVEKTCSFCGASRYHYITVCPSCGR